MNKSKIIFIGTFIIMVAFILTLSLFYSRAVKKKLHFLFQLGNEISKPGDTEPENAAININFSNDGSKIITLLNNGKIDIWNLENKSIEGTYRTDGVFSLCGLNNYIIISKEFDIHSVDINNGESFKLTGGKFKFSSIDDKCERLALSGTGYDIHVWNLIEPGLISKIRTELPVRNGLSISPDGSLLATAEGIYHENENRHETMIEMWRLESNTGKDIEKIGSLNNNLTAGVWNLFFSPDNSKLIYDTQKSTESGIAMSDLDGNIVFEKNELDSYWTRALAISPDGNTLASGDEKGNLVLWDVGTQEIKSYYRMGDVIESLEFSKNGDMLAAGLADSTIQVFQVLHSKD